MPAAFGSMPRRVLHLADDIFTDIGIAKLVFIGGGEVKNGAAAGDAVHDLVVAHAAPAPGDALVLAAPAARIGTRPAPSVIARCAFAVSVFDLLLLFLVGLVHLVADQGAAQGTDGAADER